MHTLLKFMYRYLIITTSLVEEKKGNTCNFDKALTNDFVRDRLQPAVAMVIATKRLLGQRRSCRLPSCINYQDVRTSVECVADGCWDSLSRLACLIYLIQRYPFMGTPRVELFQDPKPALGPGNLALLRGKFHFHFQLPLF